MGNTLTAKERNGSKKSLLRTIRSNGGIPAVIYGGKQESKAIEVRVKDLRKTIQDAGVNGIIELDVSGNKQNVMMTEYQYDSIKNEFIHADFLVVNLSKKMTADAPINLIGKAQGVKDGGVLQQSLHQVSVSARPKDLPEHIEVDVSHLLVGDTITIGDVRGNFSVTIENEDSEVIASILAPRQEEEINTGEQQDGGTPDNEEGRETEASS